VLWSELALMWAQLPSRRSLAHQRTTMIARQQQVRHATPRHATPRHATPRHATPRRATPHHATPRHAIPHPHHIHTTSTPHRTTAEEGLKVATIEQKNEADGTYRVMFDDSSLHRLTVVGEYTATSSYYFLLLPITPSVSCSWLDALNTPSSELPLSPAVSRCLPLSAIRLSVLLNPHHFTG
jgi:hypothetical protein